MTEEELAAEVVWLLSRPEEGMVVFVSRKARDWLREGRGRGVVKKVYPSFFEVRWDGEHLTRRYNYGFFSPDRIWPEAPELDMPPSHE